MIRIPLRNLPSQEIQVVLDDQECTISVYWRFGLMFLDLTVGDNIVCTGAICRNGASITQFPSLYFKGSLHFWDVQGSMKPPQWNGLEDRYALFYLSDSEIVPPALMY